MVKIRLIESLEDLEPISKEWDRLIKKSTVNNIFLTWDWMYVWYRHFGKGKRLFVLVCYEKDELIGIAPLVISSVFLGKKYDVLEFMGGEEACGEYLDFIIKNGKEEICINLIVKHLISSEKVCDFIHLSDVSSDSGLLALALKRFEKNGMKQISDIGRKIYYVKMSASIEDYLSGLSKNVRRNLLKNKKRTYRDFSVLEKYITKREEIDEAIKTMVNINRKRWGRRNLPGTFTSKKIIDFYKDIAVYFLRRGYLSFCILDLDGKHAAYAFSFIYNAKMYDYSVGILPEKDFLKHGIGHVAYLSKLNLAYAKACLEFDFLRGEEDYKIKYSNAMRTTSETVIVKKSLQGKFILSVFRIKFMLRNFIKKNIPEKMQWKISSFLMKSGLYRV